MTVSFRDLDIRAEYRSLVNDVAKSFYIPVLKNATLYQRAVGFFCSSILAEISAGIEELAYNGGKIQLIASPRLQEKDIEAIRKGYEMKNDEGARAVVQEALFRELLDPSTPEEKRRLDLLANLIAADCLDIKIAMVRTQNTIAMYHEKIGIMKDFEGNTIAFTGSLNESGNSLTGNYESIDVYRSWENSFEEDRAKAKEAAFLKIWNNQEDQMEVTLFPAVKEELIKRYRVSKSFPKKEDPAEPAPEEAPILPPVIKKKAPHIPEDVHMREYQNKAYENWEKQGYRGIFDMATGTGKTYTALAAICRLYEKVPDMAVIIVCPYQHLVDQWVEDIVRFNIKPIVGYSSSPQKDWKKRLQRAVRDQKLRNANHFFCFVCTNVTFASEIVQEQISKIRSHVLLVVDEAHNFGARSYAQLLDDRFHYRLALSATLDRHRDEEGTAVLHHFFGERCIEYSLAKAIEEGMLTRYKYYPIVVHLTEDELQDYEQKSYEMSKCLIKGKNGKYKLSKYGEILAMERARIIAGASEKLAALREQIKPYADKNNILVYCGATTVVDENADYSVADKSDIRQIEAVTRILGKEFHMEVAKFTSEENMETRRMIKEQFQKGDRLQGIVAIKCLDEGVNIPGIRTAFILASTTNPKEYIQRRGRVLRKAPNKPFAEIYDFVTLPRELDSVSSLTTEEAQRDLSLVKNELARIKEFGSLSMNPMVANELIWDIQETYHILDDEFTDNAEACYGRD